MRFFRNYRSARTTTVVENTRIRHPSITGFGWRKRASRLIRTFLDDIFPGNRIAVDDLVADLTFWDSVRWSKSATVFAKNIVSSSSRYSGRADLFARPGHCGQLIIMCAVSSPRGGARHPHLTHSPGKFLRPATDRGHGRWARHGGAASRPIQQAFAGRGHGHVNHEPQAHGPETVVKARTAPVVAG